jgi:hypothetical protein
VIPESGLLYPPAADGIEAVPTVSGASARMKEKRISLTWIASRPPVPVSRIDMRPNLFYYPHNGHNRGYR